MSSSNRRPNATQASFFNKHGYHGVKVSSNFQSQEQFSPSMAENRIAQLSPTSASRVASGSRSRTRIGQNSQMFEMSPRNVQSKYLAQSEGPNALNNAAWNENTDKNLQNFIQKRTNQRMKEIKREFTEAKPAIFDRNYEQQNSKLVESAYIGQGLSSVPALSPTSQAKTGSSGRPRVGTAKVSGIEDTSSHQSH